MIEARRVVHLTGEFVGPSQPWIYDLVNLPGPYAASVVCERRIAEEEFPFTAADPCLPSARHFGWDRVTRQVSATGAIRVGPRNRWRRALRRLELTADVFHAHFGPSGWMAVDAGLAPVVTSFYGYDATVAKILNHWQDRYRALFAQGCLFLAEGPAMGRRLERIGAPRARLRVLPLMAEVDAMPWRAPRDRGDIRIAMAGRFVEKKGFALGVAAFGALREPGATLTLMGEGPEEAALRGQVRQLGLAGRTRFLPFGSRSEYRTLLADSDIVLQPSLTARNGDCEGGAPTVLLDAQATGTVVVASDHDDIPFVTDPSAAFLAPERNQDALSAALAAACRSRDEWQDRSAAGRRHVELQHAPQAVARQRDDIYAEAADSDR